MLKRGQDGVWREDLHPNLGYAIGAGVPLDAVEPDEDDEPLGHDSEADIADRVTPRWRDAEACPYWPTPAASMTVSPSPAAGPEMGTEYGEGYAGRLWSALDEAIVAEARHREFEGQISRERIARKRAAGIAYP